MHKVEDFVSYFELKTYFFSFFERDFSTLKLTINENQNAVNDLKEMVEWYTVQKIFLTTLNDVVFRGTDKLSVHDNCTAMLTSSVNYRSYFIALLFDQIYMVICISACSYIFHNFSKVLYNINALNNYFNVLYYFFTTFSWYFNP